MSLDRHYWLWCYVWPIEGRRARPAWACASSLPTRRGVLASLCERLHMPAANRRRREAVDGSSIIWTVAIIYVVFDDDVFVICNSWLLEIEAKLSKSLFQLINNVYFLAFLWWCSMFNKYCKHGCTRIIGILKSTDRANLNIHVIRLPSRNRRERSLLCVVFFYTHTRSQCEKVIFNVHAKIA